MRELGIIAAVVALDRVTKLYIQYAFSLADLKPVIPGFFNIVHIENAGAAFGMLADLQGVWREVLLVGLALVVTAVIGVMLWRNQGTQMLRTALACVMGGALGNMWDRVFHGTVTDLWDPLESTCRHASLSIL